MNWKPQLEKQGSLASLRNISFDHVVHEMTFFLDFLLNDSNQLGSSLLLSLIDLEQYQLLVGASDELVRQSGSILDKYLDGNAEFLKLVEERGLDVCEIRHAVENGAKSLDLFSRLREIVKKELRLRFYPRFLGSNSFHTMAKELRARVEIDLAQCLETPRMVRFLEAFLVEEMPHCVGNLTFWLDVMVRFEGEAAWKKNFKKDAKGYSDMIPLAAAPASAASAVNQKRAAIQELVDSGYQLLDRYLSRSSTLEALAVPNQARELVADQLCVFQAVLNNDPASITTMNWDAQQLDFLVKFSAASRFAKMVSVGNAMKALDDLHAQVSTVFAAALDHVSRWMEGDAVYGKFRASDYFLSLILDLEESKSESHMRSNRLRDIVKGRKSSEELMVLELIQGPSGKENVEGSPKVCLVQLEVGPHFDTPAANPIKQMPSSHNLDRCYAATAKQGRELRTLCSGVFHLAPEPSGETMTGPMAVESWAKEELWPAPSASSFHPMVGDPEEQAHIAGCSWCSRLRNFVLADLHAFCCPLGLHIGWDKHKADVRDSIHMFSFPRRSPSTPHQVCLDASRGYVHGVCLTQHHLRKVYLPASEPEFRVALVKDRENGLGLSLAKRGSDSAILISKFSESGPGRQGNASRCAELSVGDQILEVNNQPCEGKSFKEVVNLIKQVPSGQEVHFLLKRASSSDLCYEEEERDLVLPSFTVLLSEEPCFSTLRTAASSLCYSESSLSQQNPSERPLRKLSLEEIAENSRASLRESSCPNQEMNLALRALLDCLSPNNITQVLTRLLLGRSVCLCSDSLSLLPLAGQALQFLMQPMQMTNLLLPLLPISRVDNFARTVLKSQRAFTVGVCTVDFQLHHLTNPARNSGYEELQCWQAVEGDNLRPVDRLVASGVLDRLCLDQAPVLVVDLDSDFLLPWKESEIPHLPMDCAQAWQRELVVGSRLAKVDLSLVARKAARGLFQALFGSFKEFLLTFHEAHLVTFHVADLINQSQTSVRAFLTQFLRSECFQNFLKQSNYEL